MRPVSFPPADALANAAALDALARALPDEFTAPPEHTPIAGPGHDDDVFFEEMIVGGQPDPLPEPRGEMPDLDVFPSEDGRATDLSDLVPEVAAADPLPEEAEEETPEFVRDMLDMI